MNPYRINGNDGSTRRGGGGDPPNLYLAKTFLPLFTSVCVQIKAHTLPGRESEGEVGRNHFLDPDSGGNWFETLCPTEEMNVKKRPLSGSIISLMMQISDIYNIVSYRRIDGLEICALKDRSFEEKRKLNVISS